MVIDTINYCDTGDSECVCRTGWAHFIWPLKLDMLTLLLSCSSVLHRSTPSPRYQTVTHLNITQLPSSAIQPLVLRVLRAVYCIC